MTLVNLQLAEFPNNCHAERNYHIHSTRPASPPFALSPKRFMLVSSVLCYYAHVTPRKSTDELTRRYRTSESVGRTIDLTTPPSRLLVRKAESSRMERSSQLVSVPSRSFTEKLIKMRKTTSFNSVIISVCHSSCFCEVFRRTVIHGAIFDYIFVRFLSLSLALVRHP